MSEATENLEHAVHVAHAGHDDGAQNSIHRYTGITIAVLGMFLAFCAAQVGGSRTNLIRAMVLKEDANMKSQAQSIKYRGAVSQLEALRAIVTIPAGPVPRKEDMLRFVKIVREYRDERDAAQEWIGSYDEAIEGYSVSAERYEISQLSAEIGIIFASVALLLSNRRLWHVSVFLGVVCIGGIGWTYPTTHSLGKAQEEITRSQKKYDDLRKKLEKRGDDEKLFKDVEGIYAAR